MNTSHIQKQVNFARERYITALMPDTCRLTPSEGTNVTISPLGVATQTPATAKVWRGTSDIPCRIDVSRAFRPDTMDVQTTVVDEYNLQLPFDVNADENDIVTFNGERYEIRKLKQASEWDYTVEALVMRVSADIDL